MDICNAKWKLRSAIGEGKMVWELRVGRRLSHGGDEGGVDEGCGRGKPAKEEMEPGRTEGISQTFGEESKL